MSVCTKSPTSEAPVSIVLTTVELLEPIFLDLDIRSLLTSALRVCRQWRDVIQNSRSLQRALFFECEDQPADSHEVTFNPLLVELFPLLFDFRNKPDPQSYYITDSPEHHGFNDLAIEASPIGLRRVAFYRRNASWRRMHMRKPPVKYVGLWTLDMIGHRQERMKLVKYDRGLRMEGFYALILKHVFWWDLWVRWGETQIRQLYLFRHARWEMRDGAEQMVPVADVVIGGIGSEYCKYNGNARVPVDQTGLVEWTFGRPLADIDRLNQEKVKKNGESNGLVRMGVFWLKRIEVDDGRVLWTRYDGAGYCNCGRWCTQ